MLPGHCPLLEALFDATSTDFGWLERVDVDGFARFQAELLLEAEARNRIVGVEKITADSGCNLGKFRNLLAELKFGLRFAELGATVELLRDDAFKPSRYTPDLQVSFPNGLVILVDVVRGSYGTFSPAAAFQQQQPQRSAKFRLEWFVGAALSTPSPDRQGREDLEKLCADVAAEVHLALDAAETSRFVDGLIRVYGTESSLRHVVSVVADEQLYDHSLPASDSDWLASVAFKSAGSNDSYLAGGATAARVVDDSDMAAAFLRKLSDKAVKRSKLPTTHTSIPFIVALENEEVDLRPVTVLSSLTGSRQFTVRPPLVRDATESEWRALLKEWDYVGSEITLMNYGAFVEQLWASELSGVLVTHESGTRVQWLPNPFARTEIRDPRLLDIGLPIDKLGASTWKASRNS